jgi:hypothetical protein
MHSKIWRYAENISVLVCVLKFDAMEKYWCAGAHTEIWCCAEKYWCAGVRAKYSISWSILSDACIIPTHTVRTHNNGTHGVRNFDIAQRKFVGACTIWVYIVS